MKTAIETYIESAKKDNKNLLSIELLSVIEKEIGEARESSSYLEIGDILIELSVLIELKSELLLLLFSLATVKRERKIVEEEDVLEVFSIIKNSFEKDNSEIKRKYIEKEEQTEVPLSRLSKVIREILEKETLMEEKVVKKNDYSIKKAISEIKESLSGNKRILFRDFFKEKHSRIEIILMFLAILILAKNKYLLIEQAGLFAPIFIKLNEKRSVPVSD